MFLIFCVYILLIYINIGLFGVNFKCEFIIIMMLDFVLFIFVCFDVISFLFIGS